MSVLKKVTTAVCAAAMSAALCGCNVMDIGTGNLLMPPEISSEQAAIRATLETFLDANFEGNADETYTLKFPLHGGHRTAVILEDVDDNGVNEALVLYAPTPESNVHIHCMSQREDGWQTVGDVETGSTEVREIVFADVHGSRRKEVFVGLETSSLRDSRLLLLSLADTAVTQLASYFYDTLLLQNMTDTDKQDFLLLRLASGDNAATVQLVSERENQLTEIGSAKLDLRIQTFSSVTAVKAAQNNVEIYIDGARDDGALVTDLIHWNGEQLTTPFHTADGTVLVETYRSSALPSMDIDGDGSIEWPLSSRFPMYDEERESLWLTSWYRWNHELQQSVKKMTTVVNRQDGYYLTVEESWTSYLTALYDTETRTMRVMGWQVGLATTEFLRITFRLTTAQPERPADGWEYGTVPLQSGGTLDVFYKSDSMPVTLDDILYRISEMRA